MLSVNYIILVIIGCTVVTWSTRVVPFILLKKFTMPKAVVEFLSFVPIVIMSALWFSSLFEQTLGSLPKINYENLLASFPTVLSAAISKNLLVIVVVGIVSLAVVRYYLGI